MKSKILLIIFLVSAVAGCSVYDTFVNISRLKFKLQSVNNFTVSGISIANKTKLSDFNPLDLINLTSSVTKGDFPVSFTLNVEAKNPNNGSGGKKSTDITLQKFPWTLYIDEKETIAGNISSPLAVPGKGEATIVPLEISLDLFQFFNDAGLESIVNLALNIGGAKGSTSKIKLAAKPVLGTPVGNLQYPDPLTIVDYKFN